MLSVKVKIDNISIATAPKNVSEFFLFDTFQELSSIFEKRE